MNTQIDIEESLRKYKEICAKPLRRPDETRPEVRRIVVNKRTHRIRFDNETEDRVDIVIEPRAEGR